MIFVLIFGEIVTFVYVHSEIIIFSFSFFFLDSGQNRVETGPHSWSIQLDQDLLDTIIAIYPEWFKEYSQKRNTMSEGSGGSSSAPQSLPSSGSSGSLVAEVDESPLQKTMDKNKECKWISVA